MYCAEGCMVYALVGTAIGFLLGSGGVLAAGYYLAKYVR